MQLLLLGAGFSRNWGGWLASEAFEYLLGCPEIVSNPRLATRLWRCQPAGGFEDAIDEVRREYTLRPGPESLAELTALQAAVARMFEDMNRAFSEQPFEWQNADRETQITPFLTRFDAIFTLNQDLLLEHHYCTDNLVLNGGRRWDGPALPGMQRLASADPMNQNSWARSQWIPMPPDQFALSPRSQPIFKLHGSSNWRAANGGEVMIIGRGKAQQRDVIPILSWYAQLFDEMLAEPDARLMAIGYGFRDPHINQAIARAVERGLRLFVIAPEGADIARSQNRTRAPGQIAAPNELESMIERSLIGASRRGMKEIFGADIIERRKVMRFFDAEG